MASSNCAPSLGRHEFILRRLHSLTGLMPLGGYLAFHLLTNVSIVDGVGVYQRRADQIHELGVTTVVLLLEWPIIFLPLLFHGLLGMAIVCRGKRNLANYPYAGNIRYTLQRWTGVIAFAFVIWHVFHMHGWFKSPWWTEHVVRPLGGGRFDPANAYTAAEAIQDSILVQALFAIGVLASVYHLANGLWTMGITWGVWTSERAQRTANIPCAAIGVFLTVVGLASLVGMVRAQKPGPGAKPPLSHSMGEGPGAKPPLSHSMGEGPGVREVAPGSAHPHPLPLSRLRERGDSAAAPSANAGL